MKLLVKEGAVYFTVYVSLVPALPSSSFALALADNPHK